MILPFNSIFRTTPEVSTKLYVVEISKVLEKLWLINHKRADFLGSKFWIFFHFPASLITGSCCTQGQLYFFLPNKRGRLQLNFTKLLDLPQVYFQRAHGRHTALREILICRTNSFLTLILLGLGLSLVGGCLEIDLWQVY